MASKIIITGKVTCKKGHISATVWTLIKNQTDQMADLIIEQDALKQAFSVAPNWKCPVPNCGSPAEGPPKVTIK